MVLTGGFATLTDLTGGPEGLTVLTDLMQGPSRSHGFDSFDGGARQNRRIVPNVVKRAPLCAGSFRSTPARFGSYLRSICVSEAEAWTCESSDCPLHPHGTIGTHECNRSHLCHNNVSTRTVTRWYQTTMDGTG